MKRLIFIVGLVVVAVLPANAGPQEDAKYIVEQTVTRSVFDSALQSMRPVLASALENDLRKKGINLNDVNGFLDIFVDEFIGEFTETMQQKTVAVYRELFSDKELADIAVFYKTSSGKKLILRTPELISAGSKLGRIAGAAAGRNAKARVAQRLKREGIVFNNDKSLTQRLIDALN